MSRTREENNTAAVWFRLNVSLFAGVHHVLQAEHLQVYPAPLGPDARVLHCLRHSHAENVQVGHLLGTFQFKLNIPLHVKITKSIHYCNLQHSCKWWPCITLQIKNNAMAQLLNVHSIPFLFGSISLCEAELKSVCVAAVCPVLKVVFILKHYFYSIIFHDYL